MNFVVVPFVPPQIPVFKRNILVIDECVNRLPRKWYQVPPFGEFFGTNFFGLFWGPCPKAKKHLITCKTDVNIVPKTTFLT